MALTEAQLQTLATALRAESNATVVAAMAIRNDVVLTDWCNTPTATNAWNNAVDSMTLFEATDVTKFDGLTAGKRAAWDLMLRFAPVDMTRNKYRQAVVDAWGTSDSVTVLQAMRRKATNAELYLGGNGATTNTVSAQVLNYSGPVTLTEVSTALNRI